MKLDTKIHCILYKRLSEKEKGSQIIKATWQFSYNFKSTQVIRKRKRREKRALWELAQLAWMDAILNGIIHFPQELTARMGTISLSVPHLTAGPLAL